MFAEQDINFKNEYYTKLLKLIKNIAYYSNSEIILRIFS